MLCSCIRQVAWRREALLPSEFVVDGEEVAGEEEDHKSVVAQKISKLLRRSVIRGVNAIRREKNGEPWPTSEGQETRCIPTRIRRAAGAFTQFSPSHHSASRH